MKEPKERKNMLIWFGMWLKLQKIKKVEIAKKKEVEIAEE